MDKKMIIIIVVNTVVLLGLMGGGFMYMASKMSAGTEEVAQDTEDPEGEDKNPEAVNKMCPLDTFIVNLTGEDGRRYLRVTIELEIAGEQTEQEIQKRMPQIRDAVLMILPAQSVDDILSMEGKNEVRQVIINKINSMITVGTVSNLYFTEFVIQ